MKQMIAALFVLAVSALGLAQESDIGNVPNTPPSVEISALAGADMGPQVFQAKPMIVSNGLAPDLFQPKH